MCPIRPEAVASVFGTVRDLAVKPIGDIVHAVSQDLDLRILSRESGGLDCYGPLD
jgi:hypothetical protein